MARSNLVSISVGQPMPLQIILKNTQSVASPSPFQQMLQLEASEINSVLPKSTPQVASDFHNIRFKYNYSYIPAWLESINNGVATIWVNIPVSIPANSSITIDMEVDPYLNFDGNYWGMAPQLSSTYAEYDNGVNVFVNYWNFAGTVAPSGWVFLNGNGASYNNGVTVTATTNIYYSTTTYNPANYMLEGYVPTRPSASQGSIIYTTTTTSGGRYGLYTGYAAGESNTQQIFSVNAGSYAYVDGKSITYPAIFGFYWGATASATEYTNYTSPLTAPTTDAPTMTNAYVGLGSWYNGSITFDWLRLRAYPPNGVMPSVEVIA